MNKIALGLLIPFIGTTLGASLVFLMKDEISERMQKILLGFASGVMLAASFWSLLAPAIEMATSNGGSGWITASLGFLVGVFFLLALDHIIPHLHSEDDKVEGLPSHLKKSTMLMLAVTLHNIPEGMAVGVVFAGVINGNSLVTYSGAMVLAIGIAIQNFPEGAIISLPLAANKTKKSKAFLMGTLSGIVEPIAGFLTIILASVFVRILPAMLAFAAGAMIYVIVEELVPEAQDGKHTDWATMAVATGFVIMMSMDVALG
ncbi:MAG: ZIP family metal transporter [Sphaerochaeta sp.]